MTKPLFGPRTGLLALTLGLGCLGVAACGRIGPLEQPPPFFNAQAKADYDAQKAARAKERADQGAAGRSTTGSAEREANTVADDQPASTRDIKDPGTLLTTPRDAPIPGAPNPLGPNVSTTPPN